MTKEEIIKAIDELPKTYNLFNTMDGISAEDLYDAVERFNKVPTYDELLKENKKLKQKYLDAVADYETEKSKNAAAIKILNRDVILDVEEDISEFLNRWMEETLQTLKGDTANNE